MLTLRPDQRRALEAVDDLHASGHRRVLLVIPTGGGKTVVGAQYLTERLKSSPTKRALWVTHRLELLKQSGGALERQGLSPALMGGIGFCSGRTDARVLVASLDTLVSRSIYPDADYIVFDEAHHAAASTYSELLSHYPRALVLGLTATPERGDGQALEGEFDVLHASTTVAELTELGVLVPLRVLRPKQPLRRGVIAAGVIDSYRAHADGTQALVFSPSVDLALEHAENFRDAGIDAECVWGSMAQSLRDGVVDRFRHRQIRVLTNVNVLTEGFDVPHTETAILARGCSTTGAFDQIVGRIVRSAPGKSGALLLDLRGQSHLHGLPIHGRTYSLTGVGIKPSEACDERYCRICGALMQKPGPCADCGSTAEPITLRIQKEELKAYDYRTPMRSYTSEQRLKSLTKWVQEARRKGHKIGSVFGKYRAVFGVPVPKDLLARAMRGGT